MTDTLIYAGIAIGAILVLGLILTRLYRRAAKDAALIRTGFGGEKVVLNGGILVLPVLHELMNVSLTTVKLNVERTAKDSLLTLDKIRVDVVGLFHIRVAPNVEAIAAAAQTLGARINEERAVSELVQGKLVSALRSVAATMTMEDLHANRAEFQQAVAKALQTDLAMNGLELESVSITHFDQTPIQHLDENNAFDAEGLTVIRRITEDRKKLRNEIEADNRVAIEQRNLEANLKSLEINREDEFAQMEQARAIATAKAENDARIAAETAGREQEAEQARIAAEQATEARRIESERAIRQAEIERERVLEISRQEQQIAIQNKSREESVAKAEADTARAEAIKAEESVRTVQQTAIAERAKQIAVIEATQEAEQDAVGITVQAAAERQAAEDRAIALRVAAEAEAQAVTLRAQGEADAEKLRAAASEVTFRVTAEGERSMNEAKNILSDEQMSFTTRLETIKAMPSIISESVKPMSAIDSIKIIDVGGLGGGQSVGLTTADGAALPSGGNNLAEQAVAAALKYRTQAPILEQLTREVFGESANLGSIAGLTAMASEPAPVVTATVIAEQTPPPAKAVEPPTPEELGSFYDGSPKLRRGNERQRRSAE
jgi:uncharacterized membrane protein YqiK